MRECDVRHRAGERMRRVAWFVCGAVVSGVRKTKEGVVSRGHQKNTRGDVDRKCRREVSALKRKPEGQEDRQRRKEEPRCCTWNSDFDRLPKVHGIHVHGLPNKQQFDYKPCTQGDKRGYAPAARPRFVIWPAHCWQDR